MFKLGKIFLALFICTLILVSLCCCSSPSDDWQKIIIEDCGAFRIPNDWKYFVEDDIHYIVKDDIPIMISCKYTDKKESNLYYSNYEYIDFTESAVLSNSSMYGKAKYSYNDTTIERYYLKFPYHSTYEDVEFIVWDQSVSKDTLIEIAETFVDIEYAYDPPGKENIVLYVILAIVTFIGIIASAVYITKRVK